MTHAFEIMVVSSDLEFSRNLRSILSDLNCDPLCVPSIQQAKDLLNEVPCGLIFCDRGLSDGTYRELLLAVRSRKMKPRVVVVARLTDWDDYLLAMKLGAFDVIGAPCRISDVEWMLLQTTRDYRNAYLHSGSVSSQNLRRTSLGN